MLEISFSLGWNYKGKKGKETLFHTAIGDLLTQLSDWTPGFKAIIDEVLEPAVKEQFETQGHGEWAELSPATLARKSSGMILVDTGRLESSFTKSGVDHVEQITRSSIKWGSAVPYALFHQTGTGSGFQQRLKSGGSGLPMRKILELTAKNKRKMRSIMVARLATIARRTGFAVLGDEAGGDPLLARMVGAKWLGL